MEQINCSELSSETSTYKILEFLGKGSFGKVVKCVKSDNSELVAVKMITNNAHMAEREASIISRLSEENGEKFNFVRAFDCFQYKNHTCLVFEMLGQNLHEFIKQNKHTSLSLIYIRPILQQILTALKKLKQLSLIHTDLKPENIMLVDPLNQPYRIKLIDFGCALYAREAKSTDFVQTRYYRSPEVLLGLPYCEAIDMWSVGCITAELFLGRPLYPGGNEFDQIRYITLTQGLPTCEMLNSGLNTKKYFKKDDGDSTTADWRLKTAWEYLNEMRIQSRERRKYILESLDDIGLQHMPADLEVSQKIDRIEFIDLLKRMLAIDQQRRIRPTAALKHPFMQSGQTCGNVKDSVEVMKKCSQVKPEVQEHPPGKEIHGSHNVGNQHIQRSNERLQQQLYSHALCPSLYQTMPNYASLSNWQLNQQSLAPQHQQHGPIHQPTKLYYCYLANERFYY